MEITIIVILSMITIVCVAALRRELKTNGYLSDEVDKYMEMHADYILQEQKHQSETWDLERKIRDIQREAWDQLDLTNELANLRDEAQRLGRQNEELLAIKSEYVKLRAAVKVLDLPTDEINLEK